MIRKSYPFFIYSGLLNSEHYDKIGSAIWLFLWFISSTTKEHVKDGVKWGIVLGHKPVKAREMADIFAVSEKTVRRWLEVLEQHEYIKAVRAPYGLIVSVKHSKRFTPKKTLTRPEATDRTISADHRDKNVRREIDITINHTAEEAINDIAAHFIRLRSAQEGRSVYPSPRDYQAIARIVSLGASAQEAIKWLGECFTAFEQRRTSSAETIKAFSYCAKYMEDRLNARIAGRTITTKKERNTIHDKTNDRADTGRPEKRKTSITGGQTGRIRRKPL
ncbi:phage portal protein [Bacillus velezensis]|uniref:phage portal protein n=1 Tax=Bacillus velezensis TaxID=492670 RepID=UPI001C652655|nr:phage portal protein [Bacillus velezensis]MBW7976162.1 phage portal protein [Bacillus velezensis]MED3436518.1 phage portal protein [Bacillus velezensis]